VGGGWIQIARRGFETEDSLQHLRKGHDRDTTCGIAASAQVKGLFMRPVLRGQQIGRQEAREAGYSRICLDTVLTQVAATKLYMTLGFKPIEPYVFNPISGAMFLAPEL
jgi:hypothetical protein